MWLGPHIWTIRTVLCFLSVIIVSTNGLTLDGAEKRADGVAHVILLEEHFISDHRGKRDADSSLPDDISFGIFVNGSDVLLRLHRSRLLPLVTSDEDFTEDAGEILENVGVYTDLNLASAMIVNKEFGRYSLNGTFTYDLTEWRIERMSVYKQGDGEHGASKHRIFALKSSEKNISNVEDGIFFPGDTPDTNIAEEMLQNLHVQRKDNQRRKRDATQHVIEIAFIVDYSDYQKWVSYVGKQEAIPWMRLWYTYIAESINIRYATIQDPDISIATTVTILKILTNYSDARFISNLTDYSGSRIFGSSGLAAFHSWYQEQTDIPPSDHYMLFTGFEMYSLAGMAYIGTLCTNKSVSITTNTFDGYTHIVAAHELGHSLSAQHDSLLIEPYTCSPLKQNIMAPGFDVPVSLYNTGNLWKFSHCSLAFFKTFLRNATCTLNNTSDGTVLPAPIPGQRAGEIMSKDLQCRFKFGSYLSYFCESKQMSYGGMESLCGGMYCKNPSLYRWYTYRQDCETIIPVEFTSCADNKWCVKGRCVHNGTTNISSTVTNSDIKTTTTTPVYLPFRRSPWWWRYSYLNTRKTSKVDIITETTPSTTKRRKNPKSGKKIPKLTSPALTTTPSKWFYRFSSAIPDWNWKDRFYVDTFTTKIPTPASLFSSTQAQSTIIRTTVSDTTTTTITHESKHSSLLNSISRLITHLDKEIGGKSCCDKLKLNICLLVLAMLLLLHVACPW